MRIDRLAVGVGAQKAGTTWLFDQLDRRSDIYSPPEKEVHYFDYVHLETKWLSRTRDRVLRDYAATSPQEVRDFAQGRRIEDERTRAALLFSLGKVDDAWYTQVLSNENGAWSIDITPAYALLPEDGYRHMRSLASEFRCFFVMRNPVDRSLSQLRFSHRPDVREKMGLAPMKLSELSVDEIKAKLQSPGFEARSNYIETIRRLKACLSADEVSFVFYEDLVRDPVSFVGNILSLLEISPSGESEIDRSAVNPSPGTDLDESIRPFLRERYRDMVREIDSVLGRIPAEWEREFFSRAADVPQR